MSYTVTNIKTDLTGILHGTTTNQVTALDSLISRAGRDVMLDIDAQETKRSQQIGLVFNTVYDYSVPVDLKGNKVIDIYPQANRAPSDVDLQTYNQNFDLMKTGLQGGFTIVFNNAVKSIRINQPFFPIPSVVNDCQAINDNGLWSAGSSASNLQVDTTTFAVGSASLSFDLAAAGSTGYLENSTLQSLDLSSLENQAYLFLWTYLPDASDFTNVILRWGSDSSNYWTSTATVTQTNTSFVDGWNLLAFPWSTATAVGLPDASDITYVRVTWTYNGDAQTAVRLDSISAILGQILNIEYYSKYMFRDASTGAFQENVTADSNIINLDTESCDLMLYKTAELIAQQTQGADALVFDARFFAEKYQAAKDRYVGMYKSEVQVPQLQYYRMQKPYQNVGPRIRRGF